MRRYTDITTFILIAIILIICVSFESYANSKDQPDEVSVLQFPGYFSTAVETVFDDGPVFKRGKSILYQQIEALTSSNGWSCDVNSFTISKSADFKFIARANTTWNVNGDTVHAIDVVYMDNEENLGSANKVLGEIHPP